MHRTRLRRVEPASPQLGKLIEFDNVLDRLAAGSISLAQAHQQIKQVDAAPSRYGFGVLLMACLLASACVAVLLGGGLREATFAGIVGALIVSWERALQTWFPQEHLAEITAGFMAAAGVIACGQLFPSFDQSTALLGALIILVPGFQFTVAIAELANRHLSCGVFQSKPIGNIGHREMRIFRDGVVDFTAKRNGRLGYALQAGLSRLQCCLYGFNLLYR